MTGTTNNRGYNVPEEGEENWHEPVNENWQQLDEDIQQIYNILNDPDGEDGDTNPPDDGDTDPPKTTVGASPKGAYHANSYTDGGYGVVFEASDLYIDSVVVDADLTDVSDPDLTIELRQFEDGADDPTVVDSTTVTLSGGPEQVPLGFTVPSSGSSSADANDEYVLQRGAEGIPLRRRFEGEGDWSTADFADHTYTDPNIDFIQGTLNSPSATGSEPVGSWYYLFDWLVSPE